MGKCVLWRLFLSSVALQVQRRAWSEPSVFAWQHVLRLGGFLSDFQPFVGRNPTEAKPKIQGFTPTDKSPVLRLFSTRGETMEKSIFTVLAASFVCFGSGCIRQPESFIRLGKIQTDLRGRERHQENRNFMNSITTVARIAI